MGILELGCGGRLYPEAIGVDKVLKPLTAATVRCDLGYEPLPFEDNSMDLVLCRHILEHIHESLRTYDYNTDKWINHYPVIHLFNEIYRVLKHAGILYIEIPIFPSIPSVQDPQHVSLWPMEKFRYYSGDYYSFHHVYGHESRFQMRYHRIDDRWLGRIIFQAVKTLPDDHSFDLEYKVPDLDDPFAYWVGRLTEEGVF